MIHHLERAQLNQCTCTWWFFDWRTSGQSSWLGPQVHQPKTSSLKLRGVGFFGTSSRQMNQFGKFQHQWIREQQIHIFIWAFSNIQLLSCKISFWLFYQILLHLSKNPQMILLSSTLSSSRRNLTLIRLRMWEEFYFEHVSLADEVVLAVIMLIWALKQNFAEPAFFDNYSAKEIFTCCPWILSK